MKLMADTTAACAQGAAASSIGRAAKYAAQLGLPVPANWTEIASNLYLPFNETLRYHPNFEGYQQGTPINQVHLISIRRIMQPFRGAGFI